MPTCLPSKTTQTLQGLGCLLIETWMGHAHRGLAFFVMQIDDKESSIYGKGKSKERGGGVAPFFDKAICVRQSFASLLRCLSSYHPPKFSRAI